MTLDHVGLSVADMDAQAAWYAAAFGLTPVEEGSIPHLSVRIVFLVDPARTWALELLQREGSVPGARYRTAPESLLTQGFGHICLRVADVDRAFEELLAVGASPVMAPSPAPVPGVRMAYVADPEGNLIELLDRPGPPGTGMDRT